MKPLQISSKFKNKFYKKLPISIREKTDKAIQLLQKDLSHPSLHFKPIKGAKRKNLYEARVNHRYRITMEVREKAIYIRKVGPHKILDTP